MDKQLGLLIDLQGVDLQIQRLEKREAEIPLQINDLQKENDDQKRIYEAKVQAADGIEKNRRKKERDLESKESVLAKLKDQLLSVKTNREYQALLHEIENGKQDISHLEEEILQMIEDSESAAQCIREISLEMEKSQKRYIEQRREKEQEMALLQEQKHAFESRKEALRKEISGELLKQYDKVRKSRNGLAVVSVRDGSCQGCFMSLMPQLFQEVKQNVQIYFCPHCHRILYYQEEKEPEAVS
ncbi:MAG: C4-type zinc ribbon domain-containing protein [bacterium]